MNAVIRALAPAALLLIALWGFWGCENDVTNGVTDPPPGGQTTDLSCIGCHGDQEMLIANLDAEEKDSQVGPSFKSDG